MNGRRKYVVNLIATLLSGDTITSEVIVERLQEEGFLHLGYGNADIDIVVQKFADTFGTTKVNKTDRYAAGRLVGKYGSQAVCGIVQLLGEHRDEKYTPVVGSVTQLEEKIVSVINFLRNRSNDEVIQV